MAIYRCRIRGHSASILDWSFSFSVSAVTGQAATLSADVADAFSDFWNGVPAATNAAKTLYDISTVADDAIVDELDGSMQHNVSQGITTITLAGTGAGEPLPPQVAVVGSLISDVPTRAGRGRAYFPPPTVDSMNSGKMATASRDIFANAWKNMLDNIGAAAGGAYTVCIRHPNFLPSAFTPVTRIKVGDVFDTQRRRRNKLKEAYDLLTLA